MIQGIQHKELQGVLKDFSKAPRHPSLLLLGTFGIGKSQAMRDFCIQQAEEKNLEFSESFSDINDPKKFVFLKFIVHQYDGAEIKGLPFPNEDRTETIYLPVGLLPKKGQGLIFLDEINLATRMMQNNCYQLVEDRSLGFYNVPDGFMVVGAGNLESDRANIVTMPLPLLDRFHRFILNKPTTNQWVNEYAIPHKIDMRIIGYLKFQPGDLHTYDPEKGIEESTDIATPRGWERVSDLLSIVKQNDYAKAQMYVAGKLGTAIADKFVGWLKMSDNYDITDIYSKGSVDIPKNDVGLLYSLLTGIVSHVIQNPTKKNQLTFIKLTNLFRAEHQTLMFSLIKGHDTLYDSIFNILKKSDPELYQELLDKLFKIFIGEGKGIK